MLFSLFFYPNSRAFSPLWAEVVHCSGTTQPLADFMLSISQARKIDPELDYLSDEELQKAILELYELGNIALDGYHKDHGSNFPVGLLPVNTAKDRIKL